MPLNASHKEFIFNLVDPLFDFDRNNFLKNIEEIEQAIDDAENPSHKYHLLAECLFKPQNMFLRLETYGRNIKVSEVQSYIFEIICKQVLDQASTLEMRESIRTALLKLDSRFLDDRLFVSEAPTVSYQLPWDAYHQADDIFSCTLRFSETIPASVDLNVQIQFQDYEASIQENGIAIKPNDADEYQFLLGVLPSAYTQGRKIVFDYVMETILEVPFSIGDERNPVDLHRQLTEVTRKDELLTSFVVDRFYLDLVVTKKLSLQDISLANTSAIPFMRERIIKTLYSQGKITFYDMNLLTMIKVKFCLAYSFLLFSNALDYKTLEQWASENKTFLLQPTIINFIKLGKLTIQQAEKIPVHLVNFLTHYLYADNFMSDEHFDLYKFSQLSPDDCLFLIKPEIADLVKKNILDITQVSQLNLHEGDYISKKNIKILLLEKLLHVEQLKDLTPTIMQWLNSDLVTTWLLAGLFKFEKFSARINSNHTMQSNFFKNFSLLATEEVFCKVYAKRLFAVFMQTPYMINQSRDSLHNIQHELSLEHVANKSQFMKLHPYVLQRLTRKLEIYIAKKISESAVSEEREFFRLIHGKFFSDKKELKSKVTLHQLIDFIGKYNPTSSQAYALTHYPIVLCPSQLPPAINLFIEGLAMIGNHLRWHNSLQDQELRLRFR